MAGASSLGKGLGLGERRAPGGRRAIEPLSQATSGLTARPPAAFLRDPLHPAGLHLGPAPAHSRSEAEEKRWNPEALARSRLAREQSPSLGALPHPLPAAPSPLRPTSYRDPRSLHPWGSASSSSSHPASLSRTQLAASPAPLLGISLFPSCSAEGATKSESEKNLRGEF